MQKMPELERVPEGVPIVMVFLCPFIHKHDDMVHLPAVGELYAFNQKRGWQNLLDWSGLPDLPGRRASLKVMAMMYVFNDATGSWDRLRAEKIKPMAEPDRREREGENADP